MQVQRKQAVNAAIQLQLRHVRGTKTRRRQVAILICKKPANSLAIYAAALCVLSEDLVGAVAMATRTDFFSLSLSNYYRLLASSP